MAFIGLDYSLMLIHSSIGDYVLSNVQYCYVTRLKYITQKIFDRKLK
jgi:hypothetical protein